LSFSKAVDKQQKNEAVNLGVLVLDTLSNKAVLTTQWCFRKKINIPHTIGLKLHASTSQSFQLAAHFY